MIIFQWAWVLLQKLNNISLTICLYGVGYVIPILSSVKAVIHQDIEAHHQWITYWIILSFFHIIEPFVDIAFHPWLKVVLIAWLSLPRYQGANYLYHAIVVPKLDKYETTVDGKIDDMRAGAKQRAWQYIMGQGWGIVQQLLLAGRLVKEGNLFVNEERQPNSDISDTITDKPDDIKKSKKKAPLHSIKMLEKNEEDEQYVSDFLDMLSRGLFVFASVLDPDTSSDNEELKLRVFAFEEENQEFHISPLEGKRGDETIILSAQNMIRITEAKSGQGIIIVSEGGNEVNIVLPNTQDRDTLLNGLNECLPFLKSN